MTTILQIDNLEDFCKERLVSDEVKDEEISLIIMFKQCIFCNIAIILP